MKVRLDSGLCVGHGRCYDLAAEIFDADERGHCVVKLLEIPPEQREKARVAVENCPEEALQLEE